jgi:hypothetical protein
MATIRRIENAGGEYSTSDLTVRGALGDGICHNIYRRHYISVLILSGATLEHRSKRSILAAFRLPLYARPEAFRAKFRTGRIKKMINLLEPLRLR